MEVMAKEVGFVVSLLLTGRSIFVCIPLVVGRVLYQRFVWTRIYTYAPVILCPFTLFRYEVIEISEYLCLVLGL